MSEIKEQQYKNLVEQALVQFSELESIVLSIKISFKEENEQDPRLTINIVDNRIDVLSSYVKRFKSYQDREKSDSSIEKDSDYVSQSIQSFFRKFDNPFLGSQKWYQRIKQIENQLTNISIELDKLVS